MGSSSSTKQNLKVIKLVNILKEVLNTSKETPYELDQVLPKKKKGEEEPEKDANKLKPTASHAFSDQSIENNYKWIYKNVKNQKMEIEINFEANSEKRDGARMIISFGKSTGSSTTSKYSAMTGAGDLKKILKTVTDYSQKVINSELPSTGVKGLLAVGFEPADERRESIYKYFIKNNYPDFELTEDKTELQKLGLSPQFKWFVNQNYQPPQSKTSSED